MKSVRYIVFVVLGIFLLYVKLTTSPSTTAPATQTAPAAASQPVDNSAVDNAIPPKALQVLKIVRTTGQPPEGYVGGRVFENREGRLPASGDYREFDVDPHNGGRNAERIIVEWNTKKAWYTGDHYQTFLPLP